MFEIKTYWSSAMTSYKDSTKGKHYTPIFTIQINIGDKSVHCSMEAEHKFENGEKAEETLKIMFTELIHKLYPEFSSPLNHVNRQLRELEKKKNLLMTVKESIIKSNQPAAETTGK